MPPKKRIPVWAFIFVPAIFFVPFLWQFLALPWNIEIEWGWISILLMTIGGLFGIYAERISEREESLNRKARWKNRVGFAVAVTVIGTAIGATDQIISGNQERELLKQTVNELTGGDSLFYLDFAITEGPDGQDLYAKQSVYGEHDIPQVRGIFFTPTGKLRPNVPKPHNKLSDFIGPLETEIGPFGPVTPLSGKRFEMDFRHELGVTRRMIFLFYDRPTELKTVQFFVSTRVDDGSHADYRFASRVFKYLGNDRIIEIKELKDDDFWLFADEELPIQFIDFPEEWTFDIEIVNEEVK